MSTPKPEPYANTAISSFEIAEAIVTPAKSSIFLPPAQQSVRIETGKTAKLPPNSCAFVAALNMLACGRWKADRVVKEELWGRKLVTVTKAVSTSEEDYAGAV